MLYWLLPSKVRFRRYLRTFEGKVSKVTYYYSYDIISRHARNHYYSILFVHIFIIKIIPSIDRAKFECVFSIGCAFSNFFNDSELISYIDTHILSHILSYYYENQNISSHA